MPRALLGCAPRRTLRKTLNATKRTLARARSDAARALGVRGIRPSPLEGAFSGVQSLPESLAGRARSWGARRADSPEDSKRH